MKKQYSVRTKLIIAFMIMALVPVGLLAFLNGRTAQQALVDDANQALFAVASQTADSVDNFVRANLTAIETEAGLPALKTYLSLPAAERGGSEVETEIQALLQALTRKDPAHISSYALLDSDGLVVADTVSDDVGLYKSDRGYFQAFGDGESGEPAYV